MDYYDKYIKYKSKYLYLKNKYIQKLQMGGGILDMMDEKIKNNITITEKLIYDIANVDAKTKNLILYFASKYNHQEILKLLS